MKTRLRRRRIYGKSKRLRQFYLRSNIQAVVNLPVDISNLSRRMKHSLGNVTIKTYDEKLFSKIYPSQNYR